MSAPTIMVPVQAPTQVPSERIASEVRTGLLLRPGLTLVTESPRVVRIDHHDRQLVRLRGLGAAYLALLRDLAAGRPVDPDASAVTEDLTRRLEHYLAQGVAADGRLLLVVEAVSRSHRFAPATLQPNDRIVVSRFTIAQRHEGGLVIQNPLGPSRVRLIEPKLALLLAQLAGPVRLTDAVVDLAQDCGVGAAAIDAVLGLLVGAGIVERADGDHGFASDSDPVLRQWEPADLWFHSRSRLGRTDAPFGGRFPFVGALDPQPPLKAPPSGPRVVLPQPDFDAVVDRDPGLLQVMEARRSVRRYGREPMTLDQLGELLFRAGRVRGSYGPRADAGMPYAATSRPYPCGGAAYEIELYLTVRRCRGLEPGSYYYDPAAHHLVALPTSADDRERLLSTAATSAGGQVEPDVLVTFTSRFQRVSWKYQAIAYAVTLKHVGVIYQTLYLVATAMGLAPCGLGSGDSQQAADAFGLDYLQESSVGEFLLGSLPDDMGDAAQSRESTGPISPRFDDWRPGLGADWPIRAVTSFVDRTSGVRRG